MCESVMMQAVTVGVLIPEVMIEVTCPKVTVKVLMYRSHDAQKSGCPEVRMQAVTVSIMAHRGHGIMLQIMTHELHILALPVFSELLSLVLRL